MPERIGHCQGCKWWGTHDEPGLCRLTERVDGGDVYADSLAVAHDGEMYWAGLLTAPKFGCVQWEAKDA